MKTAFFPLLVVASVTACGGGETRPSDGSQAQLVEDLRISSSDRTPELQLTEISDLVVLAGGEIVTVHKNESQLKMFDSSGTFLRTVGREGNGPGEFSAIQSAGTAGNGFWVYDLRNGLAFFSAQGLLLSHRNLPAITSSEELDFRAPLGENLLWYRVWRPADRGSRLSMIMADSPYRAVVTSARIADSAAYAVTDSAGNILRTVLKHPVGARYWAPVQDDGETRIFPQIFAETIAVQLRPGLSEAVLVSDGGIVGRKPGSLQVLVVNEAGTVSRWGVNIPMRKVQKHFADSVVERIAMGFATAYYAAPAGDARVKSLHDRARAAVVVPAQQPVLGRVLIAVDGTLWVRRRFSLREWFRMTDQGGPVAVQVPSRFEPKFVSRDHMWGVELDSLDVPAIVRLKLSR